MGKIIFTAKGLKALISRVIQAKKAAEDSSSAASSLSREFQTLAKLTSDAIKDMDSLKQDKTDSVKATLSVKAWSQDETAGYPCYCDLTVEDLTISDRAVVTIAPTGLEAASLCGLCPTNETLEGKIRLRAAEIPTTDISIEYWIEKGEE